MYLKPFRLPPLFTHVEALKSESRTPSQMVVACFQHLLEHPSPRKSLISPTNTHDYCYMSQIEQPVEPILPKDQRCFG